MIKALVDPSIFAPPEQGSCLPWLTFLKRWSQALKDFDEEAVTPVMSEAAQGALMSLGGRAAIQSAIDRSGLPIGASDVVQVIEAIRVRSLAPAESFELADVIFNRLALAPEYLNSGKTELRDAFTHDLGHGAAVQRETTDRVSAITQGSAWSKESGEAVIAGEIEAWERFGVVEEPDPEDAAFSEKIDLWSTPRGADRTLRTCWPMLIEYPSLGIKVAYREFISESDEESWPLKMEVGPQLVATMKAMGYTGKIGRIKKVFYAAAYVGCQRSGELRSLEPHPYRRSAAATSKPIENASGAKLMRGSLSKGPNAHRLMWWDGPVPQVLGVVGHDDDPRFLTR